MVYETALHGLFFFLTRMAPSQRECREPLVPPRRFAFLWLGWKRLTGCSTHLRKEIFSFLIFWIRWLFFYRVEEWTSGVRNTALGQREMFYRQITTYLIPLPVPAHCGVIPVNEWVALTDDTPRDEDPRWRGLWVCQRCRVARNHEILYVA